MNMKLINTHKKTRPIGRIANTKSNLALSVRKGVVNEARPSFYSTIVNHNSNATLAHILFWFKLGNRAEEGRFGHG